jgi:hypothetical protein
MTRQPTPTAQRGLVTQEPERIGGAARGWPGLGRLLADRWSGERPREIIRLWQDAQASMDLPPSVRLRAAIAGDPHR